MGLELGVGAGQGQGVLGRKSPGWRFVIAHQSRQQKGKLKRFAMITKVILDLRFNHAN